jgi:hypothetical protein
MDSTRLLALLVAIVVIAGIVWFFALPQGTSTGPAPEATAPATEPAPETPPATTTP